jgi:hypothetical protein
LFRCDKRNLNPRNQQRSLPLPHLPPSLSRVLSHQDKQAFRQPKKMVRHLQRNQQSLLPVFPGPETILLPQLRVWLAPVFPGPETILLPQLRVWLAPAQPLLDRVPLRAGRRSLAKDHLSSNVQEPLVAPVLVVPVVPVGLRVRVAQGAPVDQVAPVAGQERVVVAVDPVGELRELLDAVDRRVNPGSRSGQSAKNLKCGKLRV